MNVAREFGDGAVVSSEEESRVLPMMAKEEAQNENVCIGMVAVCFGPIGSAVW